MCAVNVKSKKILSIMKVTDEHVHDSKVLPELVDGILKSDKTITMANYLLMELMIIIIFLDV